VPGVRLGRASRAGRRARSDPRRGGRGPRPVGLRAGPGAARRRVQAGRVAADAA
jgi:hypothetical protein